MSKASAVINFFKSGDKATSKSTTKGVKSTEKTTTKEVKNVKSTEKSAPKETKATEKIKSSKAAKVKALTKDKKAFLKRFVKKEFADWLFSSDPKDNASDESLDDTINQTSNTLKRKQSKERSDKGSSHWRKDGDIERASKYRYTVDLEKAIEQDKQLKNINERLDSALYAITGNVPNFKATKASKTAQSSQKVSTKDPASDESVKTLNKSIASLNDKLRKQKQTVTEETAQSLLASNAKIETLLTKISADMIDEQDTQIKPVEHYSIVYEEPEDNKSFLASAKNLAKKTSDTSLFKSLLTMGLMGLAGGLIKFLSDNFLDEDGHFTFDKILPKMEEWFSDKWDGLKTWFSDTFNLDNILNSIKEWFTSNPVAALGEGFVGALAGLAGVKVTSQMFSTLNNANKSKMSEASDKVSKKKVSEAKAGGGKPKNVKGSYSKFKGCKFLKSIPGIGVAFAVIDLLSAVSNYMAGNIEAAKTDLIGVGVDLVESIPVLGTLVFAADAASSIFSDKSLAERLANIGKEVEPETVRDELDKSEVIEKSGWFPGSKDKIKDKEQLELMPTEYIKELIDTGDWTEEDTKYLQELYEKKSNTTEDENSPEFKKRKKQVIEKIKNIGKKYHEDEKSLIALCKSDEKYAKVIEQANKSNDKLGYVIQVREVSPYLSDIYERMQLALKTAFNLGHSVKLTDDEINKLLGLEKFDKTYLNENQEVVMSSEVGSDAFNESVEKVLEAEKSHDDDGSDYEKEITKEAMNHPEFFHTSGGPRPMFDNSDKSSYTGVIAQDYTGSYTTVGGSALQINDAVGGPYAQKYPKIRGICNNNPGNLRISDAKWEGKIPRAKNTDGAFEQFCAAEFGIRALVKNALNYQKNYNLWTPRDMIKTWAPPNENNSGGYVTDVVNTFHESPYPKAKEIEADTPFSMTDPELAYCMTCGIITEECGVQPYPDSVIKRAINAAIGKESLTLDTQANVTVDASADYTNSLTSAGQNAVFDAGHEGRSKNFSVAQSDANIPSLSPNLTSEQSVSQPEDIRSNDGVTLEDGSTLDTSWANPVKNTAQSDAEIAQTSEGIANASSNSEQAQSVNVSNKFTNVQQPEGEMDVSSNNMFNASVVNSDMTALEFAM